MSHDLHDVIRSLEARIDELEAERRPPCSAGRRRLRRLGVGLLALVLLVPGVALASHQFSDVPDAQPFHADIQWLADYGITFGCGGGNFCPDAPVTRGQMAAFMRRLSAEFEVVSSSNNPSSGTEVNWFVTCPDGKRAIAAAGNTDSFNLMITDSTLNGSNANVRWESDDNATIDPSTVTVFALCAPRL